MCHSLLNIYPLASLPLVYCILYLFPQRLFAILQPQENWVPNDDSLKTSYKYTHADQTWWERMKINPHKSKRETEEIKDESKAVEFKVIEV